MTLFGGRVFADITKERIKLRSYLFQVGLNSLLSVFKRKGNVKGRSPRQKQRWSYAATSQGIPEATRNLKKQGRILPVAPTEGPWPCQHIDIGLLASRTMKQYISVVLSPPVIGTLLWKPLGTALIHQRARLSPNVVVIAHVSLS